MTPRDTLAGIQYLRALAALAVVAHHAVLRAGGSFTIGAAGVDVFFIVSGFIMWVVTERRPTGPAAFAWSRITRIVPAYWTITLAWVGLAVVVPAWLPAVPTAGYHVLLSLAFIPHADPTGLERPVVAMGWTLNYEVFFYAVFTLALLLPRRRQFVAITATLVLLVGIGIVHPAGSVIYRTYTDPLLLEFLAGLALGRVFVAGGLKKRRVLGAVAVLAALAAYAVQAPVQAFPEEWRVLAWGVPALLLVGGAVALESAGLVPVVPALRTLGDASYAIYLCQIFVLGAAGRLLGGASPVMFATACVVAAAITGLQFHLVVERTLTRILRRLVRPGGRLAPAEILAARD